MQWKLSMLDNLAIIVALKTVSKDIIKIMILTVYFYMSFKSPFLHCYCD